MYPLSNYWHRIYTLLIQWNSHPMTSNWISSDLLASFLGPFPVFQSAHNIETLGMGPRDEAMPLTSHTLVTWHQLTCNECMCKDGCCWVKSLFHHSHCGCHSSTDCGITTPRKITWTNKTSTYWVHTTRRGFVRPSTKNQMLSTSCDFWICSRPYSYGISFWSFIMNSED